MLGRTLAAIAMALATIGVSYAQIPVTDAAAISNQRLTHAESILKAVEQIAQLKAQLDQAKQLYDNLNGLRNAGALMKDDLLRQDLPPGYSKTYSDVISAKNSNNSSISGSLSDIAKQYQREQDYCNNYNKAYADECRATWRAHAAKQKVGEQGYEQAAKNIQNLERFVDKIQTSPDAKSVQDLQARIAVEQVKVQNEMVKLQTVQMMEQAQADMRKRNATEGTVRMLETSSPIRF
jgi:type IV secretion system protein VirB5